MDESTQHRLLVIALCAFVVVAGLLFWGLVYRTAHQVSVPIDIQQGSPS